MKKNIIKSNVPKEWYNDIVKLASIKTNIDIEESIYRLDNSGVHFLFNNKKDAINFENEVGTYIIPSIKEYMNINGIDRTLYLMNVLFTTSREDVVVNFHW